MLRPPMERKRVIAAVVVGAALVGLAAFAVGRWGFSDGKAATPAEYQVTVVKARNRVDYALEQMAKSESLEELTTRLDEASSVAADAADELDGTGVPEGLEDANDRLVKALEGLSGELAGTAGTLRDPNFEDVLPQLRSLSFPTWVKTNAALKALKKLGIDVDQLQRYGEAESAVPG